MAAGMNSSAHQEDRPQQEQGERQRVGAQRAHGERRRLLEDQTAGQRQRCHDRISRPNKMTSAVPTSYALAGAGVRHARHVRILNPKWSLNPEAEPLLAGSS